VVTAEFHVLHNKYLLKTKSYLQAYDYEILSGDFAEYLPCHAMPFQFHIFSLFFFSMIIIRTVTVA
jgi:hypothetical protein